MHEVMMHENVVSTSLVSRSHAVFIASFHCLVQNNIPVLGMEHRNISVLDETLSQVTNNLRGDTITFQHKGGNLYNLVVIMYKKTVNYINSTVSTTKKC